MAPPPNTTTVLERSEVAPPPDAATELTYILIQFDLIFLYRQSQVALFHEIPSCSRSEFLNKIIPMLKQSLSLTLKHYLPLAGKVIIPPNSTPFVRYASGDSISLIVAESTSDFHHLTSYHPRKAKEFDGLVCVLPPNSSDDKTTLSQVCAMQITLFPNQGISIGVTVDHSVADGSSMNNFFHVWASINNNLSKGLPTDNLQLVLPSYSRASLETPERIALRSAYWSKIKNVLHKNNGLRAHPEDAFRATFIMREMDIEKLKGFVRSRNPGIEHLTSFTVFVSYLWICTVKTEIEANQLVIDDEEPEYIIFSADLRSRLNPPLPPTYFGNMVTHMIVELKHGALMGRDGLASAVDVIGRTIREAVEQRVSDWNTACEVFHSDKAKMLGSRALRIVSSPKYDFCAADYGWGRLKKFELVSAGRTGRVALSKPSDETQSRGIEIGLTMPKKRLESFTAIFTNLVNEYQ